MITVNDTSKIKKVHFKFPELFNKDAETQVINRYNALLFKKAELAKHRMLAMELEQELKKEEAEFRDLNQIITIEFEKKSFEEIKNDNSMAIINPTDYRNTNI